MRTPPTETRAATARSALPLAMLWLATAFGCTCAETTLPQPRIDSVEPAFVFVGETARLTLTGSGFVPSLQKQVSGEPATGSEVEVRIGEVSLQAVQLESLETVTAEVPATLTVGMHPLVLSFADGREATASFEVRPPVSATLTVPTDLVPGEVLPATVELTSVSAAALPAAVSLGATPAALVGFDSPQTWSGTVSSTAPATFTVDLEIAPGATVPGTVTLAAIVDWGDAANGGSFPVEADVALVSPASLSARWDSPPAELEAGQQAQLTLIVENSGAVPCTGLSVSATGDASILVGGVNPASTRVEPGATTSVEVTVSGGAAGPALLSAVVSADGERGEGPADATADHSLDIRSGPAGVLAFTTVPSPLEAGASATVEAELRNDGDVALVGAEVALASTSGTPAPATVSVASVAPGASAPLSFTVDPAVDATLTLSATGATSELSGAAQTIVDAQATLAPVLAPPSLAAAVAASVGTARIDVAFDLRVDVDNTGAVDAESVTITVTAPAGARVADPLGVFGTSAIHPIGTVAGGASEGTIVPAIFDQVGTGTFDVAVAGVDAITAAALTASTSITLDAVSDIEPPTVSWAVLYGATTVRVGFSEPMRTGALAGSGEDVSRWCIEDHDYDTTSCTPTADFTITAATAVDAATFDLTLSAAAGGGRYTVHAVGVTDVAGNALTDPSQADFGGFAEFRVLRATSIDATTIEVEFSQPVVAGPDTAGSAGCTTAGECANRYQLGGPTDLGGVASAVVQSAPWESRVTLTHANPQGGGLYEVAVANNRNADGFADTGWGAVQSGAGTALGRFPSDRALFAGAGPPVDAIGAGPFIDGPFSDTTDFTYLFEHLGKVYLGPSADGFGAVRFEPDGSNPEVVSFRFPRDTNGFGEVSDNGAAPPYRSLGRTGCASDTYACGPNNENGRALFTSGTVSGRTWLVAGGAHSGGDLAYVYMTPDRDRQLDFKYVDIFESTGGGTKGVSAMHTFDGRLYFGLPDTGGNRPYFLTLRSAPALSAQGLDATTNTNDDSLCNPATHELCYLSAERMPDLGGATFIDFIGDYRGLLYAGNSRGIMRSTVVDPLNYVGANEADWAVATPSGTAYTAHPSITSSATESVMPRDKAFPDWTVWQDRVFLTRNTSDGPQLWQCAPSTVGAPCAPADWVPIVTQAGEPDLARFGDADNDRVSLLIASATHLYIGFDNATDGVVLYRTAAADPVDAADFEGDAGCTPSPTRCAGLGGDGFGDPAANTRFLGGIVATHEGTDYLYLLVSSAGGPARVFRTSL